ncbi:MAG: hypothetical protein QOF76_5371 [Solirubrobacteraceae bacterium]|jgi:hypothetical protein|nr:hypothetical protein [Solirubrobacteraceae bacterium]
MASNKQGTTMAKFAREQRLRERRQEKSARKEARKLDAAVRSDDATPSRPA